MQPGVMITNGGPHPADKWAAQTAAHIVSLIAIDDNSASDDAKTARRQKARLELDLAEMLEDHHHDVQQAERRKLTEPHHLRSALNVEEHHPECVEESMASIAKAVEGTMFAEHFASEPAQEAIRRMLKAHFETSMHIERQWHRDLGRPFGHDPEPTAEDADKPEEV